MSPQHSSRQTPAATRSKPESARGPIRAAEPEQPAFDDSPASLGFMLARMSDATRTQTLVRLQRAYGNTAVQRLLPQSRPAGGRLLVVQRAVAAPSKPASPSAEGAAPVVSQPVPEIDIPELPATADPASTLQQIQSAPQEIERNAGAPSGGGLLDKVLDLAKSAFRGLVSGASSLVSGAASTVVGALQGAIGRALDGVRSLGASLRTTLSSGLGGLMGTLQGLIATIHQGIGGAIQGLLGRIGGIMGTLRGKLTDAIVNALMGRSDPLGAILGTIRQGIASVTNSIQGLLGGAVARVSAAVDGALNGVNGIADRVAQTITAGSDAAYGALTGLLDRASQLVNGASTQSQQQSGGVSGVVRQALSGLVDRLLSVVRRVANSIISMVRSALDRVHTLINTIVERMRQAVHRLVDTIRRTITAVATAAKNTVKSLVTRAVGLGKGMFEWVTNHLRSTWKAITQPILELITQKLSEWVAPKIEEALKQHPLPAANAAKGALASAQPPPKAVPPAVLASLPASASTVRVAAHDVLRGLMKPDGDHFAIALTGMATGAYFAGLGGGGGVQADLVIDYPSHQAGVFISPLGFIQLSGGADVKAGAELDLTGSWGSVMSFGANRGLGVEAGYSGWFTNVGGGVGAEYIGGLTTGANFYVGALPWQVPGTLSGSVTAGPGTTTPGTTTPGTTTPGTTTPGTTTPGTTTPGTTTPGTPASTHNLGNWSALYRTGQADAGPAASATRAAVSAVTAAHASNPSAVFEISVVGEASRRWAAPGKSTPDALNQSLSDQRASAVASQLNAQLLAAGLGPPTVVVHATGIGSSAARAQGLPINDDSQSFRDVSITAVEHDPATPSTTTPPTTTPGTTTPGTTTPGTTTPGTTTPGTTTPAPLPGGGPTIGWDSTLGGTLTAGVGVQAALQAGVSYSILIAKWGFDPKAETALRVVFGLSKMMFDIASLSVGGFFRDLSGVIMAFVPDAIVERIANFFIPVPGR